MPLSAVQAYQLREVATAVGRGSTDTPVGPESELAELCMLDFYQQFAIQEAKKLQLRRFLTNEYWLNKMDRNYDDHVSLTPISAVARKPRANVPVFTPGLITDCGSPRYHAYCKQQLLKHTVWNLDKFQSRIREQAQNDTADHDEIVQHAWNSFLLTRPDVT